MYFLIDYENVGEPGLRGSEWINKEDTVLLFYHDNMRISRQHFDGLSKAKEYQAIKLKTTNNNALDMYISVKIGSIVEKDSKAKMVILSKDNDFESVIEYCDIYCDLAYHIEKHPDIETAIMKMDGVSERNNTLHELKKKVSIEESYIAYKERKMIHDEIMEALTKAGYSAEAEQICDIVNGSNTPKDRYLKTLKAVGREKGNAINKVLKTVIK